MSTGQVVLLCFVAAAVVAFLLFLGLLTIAPMWARLRDQLEHDDEGPGPPHS